MFVNKDNFRAIKYEEQALESYIETDMKSFSYTYFCDFDKKEICIQDDIQSLLDGRQHFICKSLIDFLAKKITENFQQILKNTYLFGLSRIIEYQRNNLYIYDLFICPMFFASLSFFSKEEQYLIFRAFNQNISKNLGVMLSSDGRNTIFPLAYHLAKEHVENTDEFYELAFNREIRNKKLKFNDLYMKAHDFYLSDDDKVIQNLFTELCDYHLLKSANDMNGYFEFCDDPVMKCLPWEIIALIRLRIKQNLNVDCIQHPLINDYMPFLTESNIDFMDKRTIVLRDKVYADYGIA